MRLDPWLVCIVRELPFGLIVPFVQLSRAICHCLMMIRYARLALEPILRGRAYSQQVRDSNAEL